MVGRARPPLVKLLRNARCVRGICARLYWVAFDTRLTCLFGALGERALPFCAMFRGCCTIRGYTHGKEQKKFNSLLAFRSPAPPLLRRLADVRGAGGSFLPRLRAFLSSVFHRPTVISRQLASRQDSHVAKFKVPAGNCKKDTFSFDRTCDDMGKLACRLFHHKPLPGY